MILYQHYPLKAYHSFSTGVYAKYFAEFTSVSMLQSFIKADFKRYDKYLVLGGGSNVLFAGDFNGMVMAIRTEGILVTETTAGSYMVTASAGEKWDDLVNFCVDSGLAGIENMALIPGNCGSAPIQNIGAYGTELKDVFHHLTALSLETGEEMMINKDNCRFGYRDSIFKQELKNRVIITSISLQLEKNRLPDISYHALNEEINKSGLTQPTIQQVRDIVCRIRRQKLPDPAILGNAGSFFKNPSVPAGFHEELKKSFPNLVSFPQPDLTFKLAAAWLIEQCGWKGKRIGDAGVHENQALVLVNYGQASGRQIIELSENIKASVKEKFGVLLETEVNIVE